MRDWSIKLYSWKETTEVNVHWSSYPRGLDALIALSHGYQLRIYMQPYCRINRHDPFDIKITCFNNSSCKYGKNRYEMASMMYPCHTSNKWKGTTQIFTKPHVIRMLWQNARLIGLNNKQFIFWSSGGWTCESGCWCALVLVTALFLACRGFILLFSHIMEGGQCLFFLLEGHSPIGLGPHPYDLI